MLAPLSSRFELPMAFDVRVTAYALRRLGETVDFIHNVCGNGSYAKRLLGAVQEAVGNLEAQEGFRIVDHDISDLVGETVYRVKIGKYKLAYRVKPEQSVVLIFLFIHEAQPLGEDVIVSFNSEN